MRFTSSIFAVAAALLSTAAVVSPTFVSGAEPKPASDANSVTQYVIGVSPFLDKSVKDEVYRAVVRLILQDLPLNSSLSVYDAFNLKSITEVDLPAARAFSSSKTRANQFAPAIGDLKRFLAEDHPKPASPQLKFEATLRPPQFCDFLAEHAAAGNSSVTVLLIGSPLYEDSKEPAFSMVDGYFPSDGHLHTSRENSVYGFSGNSDPRPILVHWIHFGDPWISDLHQEKITRFWTLYFERRGGQLATFCGDLPTAMKAFREPGAPSKAVARTWTLNPQETKLEMLRVGRTVDVADWLTRDLPRLESQPPPSVMVGPMKIGIRWKEDIDLDLYATPQAGAETLFFQHTRSPEGYYYKDHRSSPGREYEFIEFESPVDAREVEAFVNFYKGSCPEGPAGEVRIEFDGRIYAARFSISASEGNRGRSSSGQEEFWTHIPIREILKLTPAARAAR